MKRELALFSIVTALVSASRAEARIATDACSGNVFLGKNTGTQQADGVGVRGESKPAPFNGVGVDGLGGWIGVRGEANGSGAGDRTGLYGYATGGATTNYGVFGYAYGGSKAYGVYGRAAGTSNFAGYFVGNVHISGTITNPSDIRLEKDIRALEGIRSLRPSSYLFDTTRIRMHGLPPGRQTPRSRTAGRPRVRQVAARPAHDGRHPGTAIRFAGPRARAEPVSRRMRRAHRP